MPLITTHLVALSPGQTTNKFMHAISTTSFRPLVIARVLRWIIRPELLSVSALLDVKWDLLIIVSESIPLPEAYSGPDWISSHWSLTAGVPKNLIESFDKKNERLLRPEKESVPRLTGSLDKPRIADSAQRLELSHELHSWTENVAQEITGAVSMLNLLAFQSEKSAHESYLRYGKAFAESIGSRRGGLAKIVGKVVPGRKTKDEDGEGWDEIALAHYPSIRHFADMLASEDYQAVNHKYRVPSLRDTCILCTTELDPTLRVADSAKL